MVYNFRTSRTIRGPSWPRPVLASSLKCHGLSEVAQPQSRKTRQPALKTCWSNGAVGKNKTNQTMVAKYSQCPPDPAHRPCTSHGSEPQSAPFLSRLELEVRLHLFQALRQTPLHQGQLVAALMGTPPHTDTHAHTHTHTHARTHHTHTHPRTHYIAGE